MSDHIPTMWYMGGLICTLVACVASGLLVLDHLGGLSLPGCGKGSPCAQAAASVWGTVPYLGWPVSFLGFAYFAGAFVAWLSSRGRAPVLFRYLVWFGALISLGFVLVIVFQGYRCAYCMASHAGNFGFWVCLEMGWKRPAASARPLAVVAVVFIVISVILALAQGRQKGVVLAKQERERAEAEARIISASTQKTSKPSTASPPPAGSAVATQPSTTATSTQADDYLFPHGLTGRYRWGPEQSPIRVVMFTDYQCTDCNRIEADVRKMLAERTDVSLSIKHFPMCADCNDRFKDQNMHPNACWGARAAEAAGILRGDDGFWQMHHWLFDRHGGFTDQELQQGLREMGYDPNEFIKVMVSPETLRRVQADIQEGLWLGLHFTPMVFINGVELKGVFAPQAVPRTVAAVAAKNPPPLSAENDRPPPAAEKYLADWRESPVQTLPADPHPWPAGPDAAKVKIVIWADYQEQWTAEADGIIRKWMAGRSDVQYCFRHFPFNQDCNSLVDRTAHPQACRASQAAEAAGKLGGVQAYWKMHVWLMAHQAEFNDQTLRQAVTEMHLAPEAFFAVMSSLEIKAVIEEDVTAGKPLLYRGGIPTIYVNGKVVPRWRLENQQVLERILDEAAGP
jgi:protein-disulfide isomerase